MTVQNGLNERTKQMTRNKETTHIHTHIGSHSFLNSGLFCLPLEFWYSSMCNEEILCVCFFFAQQPGMIETFQQNISSFIFFSGGSCFCAPYFFFFVLFNWDKAVVGRHGAYQCTRTVQLLCFACFFSFFRKPFVQYILFWFSLMLSLISVKNNENYKYVKGNGVSVILPRRLIWYKSNLITNEAFVVEI